MPWRLRRLADYIGGTQKFMPLDEHGYYKLTDEDILAVQQFANKVLKSKLKEDGRLGAQTAAEVKKLQKKWKLPQDGMPDYTLLSKIKRYKSRADFHVPPQPKKPKRLKI